MMKDGELVQATGETTSNEELTNSAGDIARRGEHSVYLCLSAYMCLSICVCLSVCLPVFSVSVVFKSVSFMFLMLTDVVMSR